MSNIAAEAVKLLNVCHYLLGVKAGMLMEPALPGWMLSSRPNSPTCQAAERCQLDAWSLNASDGDVIRNLIKSNRSPMWRGMADSLISLWFSSEFQRSIS